MTTLPADLTYGKVVGRFIMGVGDGPDAGRQPDGYPAVGSITIAAPNIFRMTDLAEPATILPMPIQCGIDDDGYLIDLEGQRGVWLITGNYRVEYSLDGSSIKTHDIVVTEEHTDAAPLDLTKAILDGSMTANDLNRLTARLAELGARLAQVEESPGSDALTPATGATPLPATAEPGSLLGFRVTGSATFTHSTGSVALSDGAYVFERVGGTWVYRALVAASGLTPPAPDTTPPSAGSLAASAIAATSFTLTATGASDNSALHALPYAFSSDNGSTWSAYQSSAAFNVMSKVASTAYQCRHRVRDAAGNVSTGTTITVTTTAAPTTTTYSESFTRPDGTNLVGLLTEEGGSEMHNSAFWVDGLEAGDMDPVVNGGRVSGVANQGPRCAIAPTVAAGQILTHSIDYDLTSGAGNRQVRIKVGPVGNAFAMFYVTAAGEVRNSSNAVVHSGAPLVGRIGIRANGTSREVLINGATVHTVTVAAALVGAEQFCAFAVYGSGASVDNWSVVIGT